jgi:hypothetical protein
MPSREHYGDVLQLRPDLWRVPLVMFFATLLFFLITVEVDWAAAQGQLTLPRWLSVGGPDDARAILGAMLGAVSTVLAIIFSVALLVLSMAVSQFGPRILYRFVQDAITQVTIGLFLSSFVYTLLTFVVTREEGTRQFVPQLTLCTCVVLVGVSFGFLVIFSHRIAMSIQTQNVVARIVGDLDDALVDWEGQRGERAEPGGTARWEAERASILSRDEAEGAVIRFRPDGRPPAAGGGGPPGRRGGTPPLSPRPIRAGERRPCSCAPRHLQRRDGARDQARGEDRHPPDAGPGSGIRHRAARGDRAAGAEPGHQ